MQRQRTVADAAAAAAAAVAARPAAQAEHAVANRPRAERLALVATVKGFFSSLSSLPKLERREVLRRLERLAAFLAANSAVLCAILGVLITLTLRRKYHQQHAPAPSVPPPLLESAESEGLRAALHAFAANARGAVRESLRGARDGAILLVTFPVQLFSSLMNMDALLAFASRLRSSKASDAESGAPDSALVSSAQPTGGDGCTRALAASERRTSQLASAQKDLESHLKLAAEAADAAAVRALEAGAAGRAARLEGLTAAAEAASQRAFAACMRPPSSLPPAEGAEDEAAAWREARLWLLAQSEEAQHHSAAVRAQLAAAQRRRPAGEAAEEGEQVQWGRLIASLEEEVAACAEAQQGREAELHTVLAALGVRPGEQAAGSGGRREEGGALGGFVGHLRAQASMTYAASALVLPLTALALLSGRAAEALRRSLRRRRLSSRLDGEAAGPPTQAWLQLRGSARVGESLHCVVDAPAAEFEFVWSRQYAGFFELIPGAHSPWYTVAADDVGSRVAVTVTCIGADGALGGTASARSRTVRG